MNSRGSLNKRRCLNAQFYFSNLFFLRRVTSQFEVFKPLLQTFCGHPARHARYNDVPTVARDASSRTITSDDASTSGLLATINTAHPGVHQWGRRGVGDEGEASYGGSTEGVDGLFQEGRGGESDIADTPRFKMPVVDVDWCMMSTLDRKG